MLNHRGKILRTTIDKYCNSQGVSITAIAHKAGYNQATIYRHFDREDLPYHIIRKYGKAINHDFRMEYPEMEDEFSIVSDDAPPKYGNYPQTLSEVIADRDKWREKYYKLLEIHNRLLLERLGTEGI